MAKPDRVARRIVMNWETWQICVELAEMKGVKPHVLAADAILAGLSILTPAPRSNSARDRKHGRIPYVARRYPNGQIQSPASFMGWNATGDCHGCGKPTDRGSQLYCPTCRERARLHGWCGCGAALYANGCDGRTGRKKHRRLIRPKTR